MLLVLLLDGSSRLLANSLIAEQAEASRLPTGPANRPTLAVATDPHSPWDSLWLEHRLSHGLAHLCPTLRHAGRVPAGDRGSRCCHRAPGIIHAAPVAPHRSCSRAWLRTSAAIALRCAAGAAVPVPSAHGTAALGMRCTEPTGRRVHATPVAYPLWDTPCLPVGNREKLRHASLCRTLKLGCSHKRRGSGLR